MDDVERERQRQLENKIPAKVAELLKQRNLRINWSQLGGESFNDQDAVILQKILMGNYVPDDVNEDEGFFKQLQFESQENDNDDEVEVEVVAIKQAKPMAWYIVSYDNRFRIYWDLFIILLAVYNCILIPIDVGFGKKFYGTKGATVDLIDSVLDIFFAMDFVLNFFTTFVSPKTGLQVIEWKKIAINYLTNYNCYIDLLATIPFD